MKRYEMKKNSKISVRLNETEEKALQQKADLLGMSIGQYLRFVGLHADLEVINIKVRQKVDKPF